MTHCRIAIHCFKVHMFTFVNLNGNLLPSISEAKGNDVVNLDSIENAQPVAGDDNRISVPIS